MLRSTVRFALCLLTLCAPALATTYSWTLQTINSSANPETIALGMGRNLTWPTVIGANYSEVKAYALSPVGWSETSLGPRGNSQGAVRVESGPGGQVGVVWASQTGFTYAETSRSGWQLTPFAAASSVGWNVDLGYSSANRPAVAYVEQGYARLASHDGTVWNTEDVTILGTRVSTNNFSMDVDSLDRVGLAYSTGSSSVGFAMRDPLAGGWARYTAPPGQQDPLQQLNSSYSSLSLAFGPNDEAGLLIGHYDGFTYAWFDIRSGTWKTERVAQGAYTQGKFSNLIFDSTGAPAFAYIDQSATGNNIHYRRKVGFGWQDVLLPARGYYGNGVSLAFDSEDLPVIAFRSDTYPYYGLTLAYDPIVVPEPASALLVGLGFLVLRRRGH